MSTTRRDFLKTATTAALGTAIVSDTSVFAGQRVAGSDAIRIGVIGCGGRGTGAVDDAISSSAGVTLVAMGDMFGDRLDRQPGAPDREVRRQDRCRRSRVHRPRRLREGHRDRRELHHPRDPSRVSARASRRGHRRGQEHLHREAGRGRRARHPRRARGLRAGEDQGPRHRSRHAAPAPDRLSRGDEAHPRRRHRQDHRPRAATGTRAGSGTRPPGGMDRRRVAAAQLAVLHLALRRSHRRAARAQHRRRQLGDERAPGERERHGRPPGADRARTTATSSTTSPIDYEYAERHAAGEPVPPDPGMRQQRHGGAGRRQGRVPAGQQRQVRDHRREGVDVPRARTTIRTCRSTPISSRPSAPASRTTS